MCLYIFFLIYLSSRFFLPPPSLTAALSSPLSLSLRPFFYSLPLVHSPPKAAFTIYHATNATDIFTMENRRLQAGLEYTAKYNLNYTVPYIPNCGPPGLPHPKGQGWCFKTISNVRLTAVYSTAHLSSVIFLPPNAPPVYTRTLVY